MFLAFESYRIVVQQETWQKNNDDTDKPDGDRHDFDENKTDDVLEVEKIGGKLGGQVEKVDWETRTDVVGLMKTRVADFIISSLFHCWILNEFKSFLTEK